jgi:hypothetical protein
MKHFSIILVFLAFSIGAVAQNTSTTSKKSATTLKTKSGQANDHLLLQLSSDKWDGLPDSVGTKGFSRGANLYFMMNFPFKSNRNFSTAVGAGIGSSHLFLSKRNAVIEGSSNTLQFQNLANTQNFKKYKVAVVYFEAPVELRWVKNADDVDKSLKFALGVKAGTLLSAYTKGKRLLDASGNEINNYTEKIKKKSYFNSNRVALTARVGWGHFSVFGQYQVTTVFKENLTAPIRPFSVGLTISGL